MPCFIYATTLSESPEHLRKVTKIIQKIRFSPEELPKCRNLIYSQKFTNTIISTRVQKQLRDFNKKTRFFPEMFLYNQRILME